MKPTPDLAEILTQLRCASRVRNAHDIPQHLSQADCKIAADEIERLQAENERLRKLTDRPRDDGTAIAVGGEPGASAGKSE